MNKEIDIFLNLQIGVLADLWRQLRWHINEEQYSDAERVMELIEKTIKIVKEK